MPVDEPDWWYGPADSASARLLTPAAKIVTAIAARRWRNAQPFRSSLAVVCIGNFTAGGTGKTPLARAIARLLAELGEKPVFLSRGYGGSERGPHRVDSERDAAARVGDEPLLLARDAPTFVARDRAAGARAIAQEVAAGRLAATVIVLDDGMQNPTLAKDLTLAVVDGRRGFGNGRVLPAGPLREPLAVQMPRVDAVIVNAPPGGPAPHVTDELSRWWRGPTLLASVEPAQDIGWLAGVPLVAFAGIGHPRRFFDLLRDLGGNIAAEIAFADHHALGEAEASRVIDTAKQHRAAIVTTEKDLARLSGGTGSLAALREIARALPIRLAFSASDRTRLTALLRQAADRRFGRQPPAAG